MINVYNFHAKKSKFCSLSLREVRDQVNSILDILVGDSLDEKWIGFKIQLDDFIFILE